MILPLIKHPNEILRKKSEKVYDLEKEWSKLTGSMIIKVMNDNHGVGLAAPQIGILKRIIAVNLTGISHGFYIRDMDSSKVVENGPPFFCATNPVIIATGDGVYLSEEGCLSLPGEIVEVPRFRSIVMECVIVPSGMKIQYTLHDLAAAVVQHEIDHLDGKLIIDYK